MTFSRTSGALAPARRHDACLIIRMLWYSFCELRESIKLSQDDAAQESAAAFNTHQCPPMDTEVE
jgi:hypothetical protein